MRHALVFALVCFACGSGVSTTRLQSADIAPAATGVITAAEAENRNIAVRVRVDHLAPASRLRTDARTFVVWFVPPNAAPQNAGALQVDRDLQGELSTITPLRGFQVYVTAEPTSTVTSPTETPILRGWVEK